MTKLNPSPALSVAVASRYVPNRRVYTSLADFNPAWLVAPGETIEELLIERGWTKAEFAVRTEFTDKHIGQLLKGNASITEETALKLECVLGSTAKFWMNLEAQYREQIARRDAAKAFACDAPWLKELPLADMVRLGWVKKFADKAMQVRECLHYFGVASVNAWREQFEKPVAAYRASETLTKNNAAVTAWLRFGEREGENARCKPFNKVAFEAALHSIKPLTAISDPSQFMPQLIQLCADAGVVVVLEAAPKGCPVSGAAKWLAPDRALIMLSGRGKTDDLLWFTFFHEAAHLIKHGKKLTFLDEAQQAGLDSNEENEANQFARDFLIDPKAYEQWVQARRFKVADIRAFAKLQGVSPGIVEGRLQFDKHLSWQHLHSLKLHYTFA